LIRPTSDETIAADAERSLLAVILARWERSDAPALVDGLGDEEIQRWTPLPKPRSPAEAREWIARRGELSATDQHEHFAIRDEASGELAGGLNLFFHEPRRAELGYFILAPARRRGLASSAVRLAAAWAHENGVERLEAMIDTENVASFSVVESAGFRREGLLRYYRALRGVPRDMYIYARLGTDPLGSSVGR
jgi:[ribosomal protein S5]-alanine N-acetyltransferase